MNKQISIIVVVLVILAGVYWLSTLNVSGPAENTPTEQNSGAIVEEPAGPLPYMDDVNDLPLSSRTHPTLGKYLTDSNGFTLYTYKKDGDQKSVCTGSCAETWIPFLSYNEINLPGYVDELTKQLNFATRPDKKAQFSFGPDPVYYYSGDKKPGDVNGNGMDSANWSIVNVQ